MMTAFIYKIIHLMQANAAFTNCDAKACYDRIVVILTSLTEYKAGLPAEACILQAKALKQMKYTMITAYGPSEITNQHTPNNPLHGRDQGLTDAPAGCTFLTDICTKCYDKVAHGFTLADPSGRISITQNAKQFIDDNKLAHNGGKRNATAIELMAMEKHDTSMWDSILNTAGGLLELKKTAYSLLVWKYKESGEPQISSKEDIPSNKVYITRKEMLYLLTRVSATTPLRMLGVNQAINQTNTRIYKQLETKTGLYTRAITACPLQQQEVLITYKTIYIPSIVYSLQVSTITQEEYKKLHAKLYP
eukprot:15366577-Ditylum_brightwellii.AAC.1